MPLAEPLPPRSQTSGLRKNAACFTYQVEDEADCWELVARAGGKFFSLPELHPSTRGEVAQAIHVLQDKLLTRPAYRKYRESAGRGR